MQKDQEVQSLERCLRTTALIAKRTDSSNIRIWLEVSRKNIRAAIFYGQFNGFHVEVEPIKDGNFYSCMFTMKT